MAIEKGTEMVAVTTEERTWRINILTPKGAMPVVTMHRETIKADAAGAVLAAEQNVTVTRTAAELAAKSYTAAGVTVTGAQLAALIAEVADVERQADLVAEAQRQADAAQAAPE